MSEEHESMVKNLEVLILRTRKILIGILIGGLVIIGIGIGGFYPLGFDSQHCHA